jgi:hypothetical protein
LSSAGKRQRYTSSVRETGAEVTATQWGEGKEPSPSSVSVQDGKQITVSESHPRNRSDGSYREGGPFYTSRVTEIFSPGYWGSRFYQNAGKVYRGPVYGAAPTIAERKELGYGSTEEEFGDKNESQLLLDGTTAISLSNPINPASQLGTSLSESYLEGLPSIPGIQLWKDKTKFLKGLGSEYLNYQFGWAPLHDEVSSVVDAARRHRDLLQQYHRGEGSDTHREFHFPIERSFKSLPAKTVSSTTVPTRETNDPNSTRQVFWIKETKKWFVGCFTYGLPSSTDSWRKALGFGSDADVLYGLSLSPEILWELTPWSWAVDWFSNAGDVINNVTNFGLAGLVMRYGYIMEESISKVYAEGTGWSGISFTTLGKTGASFRDSRPSGKWVRGTESVTKRRYPASPFGFGLTWEGLSPTQLAITAALGITRVL